MHGRGGACPARGFTVTTTLRLVRRGGIYAARCSHTGNATQRVNATGRIYASPTNLPTNLHYPQNGRVGQYKSLPRDFMAKQKRGGHCPASFFIKRRRKTERLAVSCNETEPTPLQADALPSDPAGRSGIPLLYRTMGMFFVPVLSFDAYIVHDFCRNCKRLRCTMCCKIYVYFCATCPIF